MDRREGNNQVYMEGEPCDHPGCLRHLSHPCEGCGRIGGRSVGKNSYTCIKAVELGLDKDLYVCDDCGAFGSTEGEVNHHESCVPGEFKKWQKDLCEGVV